MRSEPETIDAIIERVTIDASGDEGHTSFLCAFEDEVDYPIAATLAGTPVTLHDVDYDGHPARGLVGVITNDAGQHRVGLIELDLEAGYPPTRHGKLFSSERTHRRQTTRVPDNQTTAHRYDNPPSPAMSVACSALSVSETSSPNGVGWDS